MGLWWSVDGAPSFLFLFFYVLITKLVANPSSFCKMPFSISVVSPECDDRLSSSRDEIILLRTVSASKKIIIEKGKKTCTDLSCIVYPLFMSLCKSSNMTLLVFFNLCIYNVFWQCITSWRKPLCKMKWWYIVTVFEMMKEREMTLSCNVCAAGSLFHAALKGFILRFVFFHVQYECLHFVK